MPHQDTGNLRSSVLALKDVLDETIPSQCDHISRHGNAVIGARVAAITAMLTFGWTIGKSLTVRFETARDAAKRVLTRDDVFESRQGLLKALLSISGELLEQIRHAIIVRLKRQKCWLLFGRPTFGVDGSKFQIPRTKANQQHFAASARKGDDSYKSKSDRSKASTTQVNFSLCFHFGSSLPFCWKAADSGEGERGMLLNTLDQLPSESRLVMDAFYFGYAFWTALIEQQLTFVVRAGSNIEVMKCFRGKVKFKDGIVLYWPENAISSGKEPIVLRLVEVMVGRKRMFLLTNELNLTDEALAELYRLRWGIEVFFRTVKQNWERAKLECRTPQNVFIELEWTLMGVWASLWLGRQYTGGRLNLSPVRVLRTIAKLVSDVSRRSSLRVDLAANLRDCIKADESNRKASKDSRDYPRKKKKKPTGTPSIRKCPPSLIERAKHLLGKKSLPA